MAKKNEKVIKDSKKMARIMEQIEEVFDKAYAQGITPNMTKEKVFDENAGEEKEVEISIRWGENTRDVYKDMVKSFVRDINEEYDVSSTKKISEHAEKVFQKRIDKFHESNLSESYNLQTLTAALTAFNKAVSETSVFKKEFELGDCENYRKMMRDQHVVRYAKTSTTMRATPVEARSVLDNIKSTGYNTKMRETAYHVASISMLTGGRISAILKLKTSDFEVDEKNCRINFFGDKGGKDNTVKIDRETAAYLKSLTLGKKDNERIFSAIRTQKEGKGTFMSTKELRKSITRIITKAGSHLNTTKDVTVLDKDGKQVQRTVVQKFTSHSFRKSFAVDRVLYYSRKFDSKSAVDKYISRRISEDQRIKEKLDTLRSRMNKHRLESRELSHSELAIFFTSVDLGHYRNEVITSYYTTFKEVMKYVEETN